MMKTLFIKLTIWSATLFLAGIIMLAAGNAIYEMSFIDEGTIFILVGVVIGIIGLIFGNKE